MINTKVRRIDFNIVHLNPSCNAAFAELIMRARTIWTDSEFRFEPFEGFRHPERQYHLLTVDKTTKAGPWKSAHQYGLAVDFAGHRVGPDGREKWTWDLPTKAWDKLRDEATACGLRRPIDWDLGHIEAPQFQHIKSAWRGY